MCESDIGRNVPARRRGAAISIGLVLAAFVFSTPPASALGTRDAAAVQAMADFAAGKTGVVCWNSRRVDGRCRIWACDFDGANLRQVSPDVTDKEHVAPVISPDGSKIAYLQVRKITGTGVWGPGDFYEDTVGDMMIVDSGDTDGSSAQMLVSSNCRTFREWRFARWIDDDRIAYIGSDHDGYVYTISSGASVWIFDYPNSEFGALPNPQLSHSIDGHNNLYRINNPGPGGTLARLREYDGCQGCMADDGWRAYRTRAQTPRHIMGMKTADASEWSVVDPSRFPSGQDYLYFPKLSPCQKYLAIGASPNEHHHYTSDYDVFVVPMDPTTLTPTGDAVKYCFGGGTSGKSLDSWPDVWVSDVTAPPELTRIDVSPSTATIQLGANQAFAATPRDQYGDPFSATVSWSVSGGGTMSPPGGTSSTFGSDGTTAGAFTVTASAAGVTGTATVTVYDPSAFHVKINCGGGTVADWQDDDPYVSGGADHLFSGSPDTSGVTDPAPAEVYLSCRRDGPSFSVPVADGAYTVRLHFYDNWGGVEERAMTVTIEGQTVLQGLNIKQEVGLDRALVKEFADVAVSGGSVDISVGYGTGNDAFVSAVEVIGGSGGDPVLSTINVTPTAATIHTGGSQSFSAETLDQYGDPISAVVAWSVSGGGSMSKASGPTSTFQPDGSSTGTFTVTASSGSVQGSATVTVTTEPSLVVISPNGGEVLYVGTTYVVRWSAVLVDNVAVMYSPDNGADWRTVNPTVMKGGAGWLAYGWTVPDAPSGNCLVRVDDYGATGAFDESNAVFEIHEVLDSDGDGMDDGWEMNTFGDMTHDETTDTDGDGKTDYEEFMAGTDPLSGEGGNAAGVGLGCRPGARQGPLVSSIEGLLVVLLCALRRRPARC